jgi:hypothetical protein
MSRRTIVTILIIAILGVIAARLFLGGPEDDWICANGQWIKHGKPVAPMPTETCKNKSP